MKKGFPHRARIETADETNISAQVIRAQREPNPGRPRERGDEDLARLRSVLKRAVERDLAPRTLIDSIGLRIREADESR